MAATSSERYRHGAVITRGGRLLGTGINRELLDPYYYSGVAEKFSVHAEEAAIARIQDLRGATIYVARTNNRGEPRMSKPCSDCQRLIDAAGIRKVFWTDG